MKLIMDRNREAIDEDRNISRRLRNLEFTAVRAYQEPELKPVEPKDAVEVFKLQQYISSIENVLTDISVDLDDELNRTIANIAETPEKLIAKPVAVPKLIDTTRPLKEGIQGSGIKETNIISKLISSWNAFINYLTSFKKLNQMTQKDMLELHDELDNLVPTIEKNINNILIIDANENNNKYDYEKRVLETLDDRILSKNLSKITLRELDKGIDDFQNDVQNLTNLAQDINDDNQDREAKIADINMDYEQEKEKVAKDIKQLEDDIRKSQLDEKIKKRLTQIPAKSKHPDYQNLQDMKDYLKELQREKEEQIASIPSSIKVKEFEDVRKRLRKGRGVPVRPAIHFNDELNDLNKFYS
jgi:hypothetical protein